MKGIDVSNNQGCIDFAQVKNSGVEIVYIKATEGITYTDPYLITNYNNAKVAGLKVGFYHFLRANNPITEAQHFLRTIQCLQEDCLCMVDAELPLGQTIAQVSSNVLKFADYLISQGKQVGIYTGDYFYRDNLNNTVKDLPLWIARYASNPMASNYIGWQYSDSGRIPGINGNVDLNNFSEEILISGGIKKVENLVVVNRGADENSAEILADFLNCPVIKNDRKFDYTCAKNIIGVGGKKEQYTSYLTRLISSGDRYGTNQAVLDFIKNGGK